MISFIHSGVIDPVQLSMARYERYRLERLFEDEYGMPRKTMSYIVLQQSNQKTTEALTDTYPSFHLVSENGPTIAPTRCFVLSDTGPDSIKNLSLLFAEMCHPNISIPKCSFHLERFLQALKLLDSTAT